MAHMVETMAYAGETPWHGLGVQVTPDLSTDEMLIKAGLDWSVSKRPMFASRMAADGQLTEAHIIPCKGHNALVRDTDEKVLDVVGDNYVPVQNKQAMQFFRDFTDAGDMKLETAGSLDGGRQVWVLANLGDEFELAGGDKVKGYLLLSQPHIYGKALNIMFTPIRVVCNNTLTMALKDGKNNSLRLPHIRPFDEHVQLEAKHAMGLAKNMMSEFALEADTLAKTKADEGQVVRYMSALFQPSLLEGTDPIKGSNVIDFNTYNRNLFEVKSAMGYQPGANLESSRDTWWGAFNAVTYMADHVMGRDRDKAVTSAWFGERARLKRRALELALGFAHAA